MAAALLARSPQLTPKSGTDQWLGRLTDSGIVIDSPTAVRALQALVSGKRPRSRLIDIVYDNRDTDRDCVPATTLPNQTATSRKLTSQQMKTIDFESASKRHSTCLTTLDVCECSRVPEAEWSRSIRQSCSPSSAR